MAAYVAPMMGGPEGGLGNVHAGPFPQHGYSTGFKGMPGQAAPSSWEQEAYTMFGIPELANWRDPRSRISREYRTFEDWYNSELDKMPPGSKIGAPQARRIVRAEIITAEQEYSYRELLPLHAFTGVGPLHIHQLTIDPHMLDLEPELGVPRLVTFSSEMRTIATDRWGLSLMMEMDAATTPMGKRQYEYSLQQISAATRKTIHGEVMTRLLQHHKNDEDWFGYWAQSRTEQGLYEILQKEWQMWSIISKGEHGLPLMIDVAQHALSTKNVTPDTIVLPSGIGPYMRFKPENWKFFLVGPKADRRLMHEGPMKEQLRAQGLQMFESMKIRTGKHEPPIDPLDRVRVIGEFFQVPTHDFFSAYLAGEYQSSMLDPLVFDWDNDAMTRIPFLRALDASGLFGANGDQPLGDSLLGRKFLAAAGNEAAVDTLYAATPGGMAVAEKARAGGNAEVLRVLDKPAFAFTRQNVETLLANNVPPPFGMLLLRPHMTFEMASAIVMKRGAETGGVAFGNANFVIGADIYRKSITGHFTCRFAAYVARPENIFVVPNVFPRKYLGGGGCEFNKFGNAQFRSSYGEGQTTEALFAVPTMLGESFKRKALDITGRWRIKLHNLTHGANGLEQPHFWLAHSVAEYWGWSESPGAADNYLKNNFGQADRFNTIVARGFQYFCDPAGKPVSCIRSTGHWQDFTPYDGFARHVMRLTSALHPKQCEPSVPNMVLS